jgi:hypothetical protein
MRVRSLVVAALVAGIGSAHDTAKAEEPPIGYAFVGPVAVTNLGDRNVAWNVGGGAETRVRNATSIGGEIGYLNFPSIETHSACCAGSMPMAEALLLSVNVARQFSSFGSGAGWRPFATGGLSFLLGGESIGLFNVGGGADRWVTRHAGLRFEVRDQLFVAPQSAASLLLGVRVGVVFR